MAAAVVQPALRVGQRQRALSQWPLHDYQQRTAGQRGEQRPAQDRANLVAVTPAQRLRHQPRGTHAQETKSPENEAEDHRPQGHRTDIHRVAQMPCHGGIHCADQWHRQVGQYDGRGQRGYATVPVLRVMTGHVQVSR
jgi:hypothetical protein